MRTRRGRCGDCSEVSDGPQHLGDDLGTLCREGLDMADHLAIPSIQDRTDRGLTDDVVHDDEEGEDGDGND